MLVVSRYGWAPTALSTHFVASMLSGVMLALSINPFDVVSTRLYNQPVCKETGRGLLYRGLGDCLTRIVREEGVMSLWKGVTANYLRVGPHTVLTFMFWERLKALLAK